MTSQLCAFSHSRLPGSRSPGSDTTKVKNIKAASTSAPNPQGSISLCRAGGELIARSTCKGCPPKQQIWSNIRHIWSLVHVGLFDEHKSYEQPSCRCEQAIGDEEQEEDLI